MQRSCGGWELPFSRGQSKPVDEGERSVRCGRRQEARLWCLVSHLKDVGFYFGHVGHT